MINNDNNEKKGLSYILIGFAITLFIVILMINITPISNFLSLITSIIAPIVIGGAIAYSLNPILKFLEFIVFKRIKSKHLIRVLSLILTYVYALVVITLIVGVAVPQLMQSILDLGKNYDVYIEKTTASLNALISKLSINFENINVNDVTAFVSGIINESGDIFQTVLESVLSYGSAIFTAAKNILLGLFISIYILSSKERLYAVTTKAARAFMTAKVFNNCMKYVRIASSTFGRFFIGKLFDSTIVFIITLALLSVFGIPHATFIAMIVGVLNIIHFFGIIIAIVLSAFIVLIAAPSKLLLFLLIMIVIQQIESNVIAPKILGSSAGISSLGVIAAVIIMGSCFGIIGMIIGVPIFAIIIAIFKDYLDNKLAKKNLPVNTSNYYTDHDYSSENEEYKPLTKLLLDPVFKKISKRLNVAISHDLKKDDITEEDTNYDDEVTSDDSNIEENTEENK
ncbi:MAG: AI-2E family transporter [Clostridia bacterium]|nr:AI-2E family transporter [Clostridia bacterium]